MDRLVQIANLWSWLPAFRAVAEVEHVGKAARKLRISASALARSIHLLEEGVGETLFERSGRNLKLTSAGHQFLITVRNAMRQLDDGVQDIRSNRFKGALHLSSPAEITAGIVLPATQLLLAKHPDVEPHLHCFDPEALESLLLQGELDLAIVQRLHARDTLHSELLGPCSRGVYASREHPIVSQKHPTLEELQKLPFVVPIDGRGEPAGDAWPDGLKRHTILHVADYQLVLEALLRLDAVAVLPDYLPRMMGRQGQVRRIALDIIPSGPLYALQRRRIEGAESGSPGQTMIACLRQAVSATNRKATRHSRAR